MSISLVMSISIMNNGSDKNNNSGPDTGVVTRTRPTTKKPSMYKVLLLNDDYTTMEFVVAVLENIFQKSPAEAFRLMMQVHTQGRAICGIYTFEVAETKVTTVRAQATTEGFPLQAHLEEDR